MLAFCLTHVLNAEDNMQRSRILRNDARSLLTVAVLAGALGACAHAASEQLVDARRAYDDAASSPARTRRPNELEAARVALERAEEAHDDHPGSQREKRLASEAEHKARLARAHGEEAAAEREANQAEREAAEARARANEAERARANDETRGEARAEERADARAEERREAPAHPAVVHTSGGEKAERAKERRSSAALQNLASVAAVREEPRGVVITLSGALLFPSGKEELSPIARQNLDQVAHALAEQPAGTKFEVIGHTDNSGTANQNKQLSLSRARAVAEQLSTAGIERDRVEVEGYGETRPIAGNDTPEGRASNRRVEIVVARPVKTASK
jgi:outer membrane protein OmpA-like peptidoglycan-associated protein